MAPKKGFSAGQMRRMGHTGHRQPARSHHVPTVYQIVQGDDLGNVTAVEMTFKEVCVLCPGVNVSTLRRRLVTGARHLADLARPAMQVTSATLRKRQAWHDNA